VARKEITLKKRTLLALFLATGLAALAASSALARPPVDDAATDATPIEVGIAEPAVAPAAVTASAPSAACSSGAHTLSHFGDRVYPEEGNGGYTSLHTDVHLNYSALANTFLPGTHVDLTVRATQCLTDLSFDFERSSSDTTAGPNMTVNSVEVDGSPATFTFVQPTYPGDPNGQDDPDPAAHTVSNVNPASATNPNPPACSPQVSGTTQNGTQCPATKLVVTPAAPIADGTTFTVTIDYTGRPGIHHDGDGTTEGWFRVNTTAAPNDGSFVTTEPIGTASWMPLNNHPSAKPTYDFYDTVDIGKTAIANGELVGTSPPVGTTYAAVSPTSVNLPDANFPGGSWTWHWHSPEHVANYLVENSIGSYDLVARTSPTTGIQYFEGQGSSITAANKASNKANMDQQEDITSFQSMFNGPYPFTTAGVIVGIPSASFEEEMQTKITFAGGRVSSLGTLNHENMHQWFGDNVSEAAFNLTFWKEGWATIGEYLATARSAATTAGGLGTPAGDAAFDASLNGRFNTNYGTTSSSFWTTAPSNPTVGSLFSTSNTYTRPGTAYLALREILGQDRWISVMKQIQKTYGGGNITEPQLESAFRDWLPVPSASCNARLDQFFPQWFDTAYGTGGANTTNKPALTGPGLNGTGFVCAQVSPAAPNGQNGWYTSQPTVTWQGYPGPPGGPLPVTKDGCVDGAVATEGTNTLSCSVTTIAAPILSSGAVSETVKLDTVAPSTGVTLTPTAVGAWYSPRTVSLAPTDATSGVARTEYRLDGGPWTPYTTPFSVDSFGPHTLDVRSTDFAGNVESGNTTSWGSEFTAAEQIDGLSAFTASLGLDPKLAKALLHELDEAGRNLGKPKQSCDHLDKYLQQVIDQAGVGGSRLTLAQAGQLFSANQIEALLACIPAGSPAPAAEQDVLDLVGTIAGMGLDKPVADDLDRRARDVGEDVVDGSADDSCRSLGDLAKKIADLRSHGKLSTTQAATLGAAVAQLERLLGC
jgi:hypothetical protein